MPSTSTAESAKPRALPLPLAPTMAMVMGIIGYTQGVSEAPMPARKTRTRDQTRPECPDAGAGAATCAVEKDGAAGAAGPAVFPTGETAGFSAAAAAGAAVGISDAFTSSARVVGGKQTPPSP